VEGVADVARAKRGSRLPVVLSMPETAALLGAMRGTTWLMAALIYGGGLRVSECCELRIKDIDFDQGLVVVRGGKGDTDRQIQDYLGHVNVETTMVYTHVVKELRNPSTESTRHPSRARPPGSAVAGFPLDGVTEG
jgi:site-specific recombinase XerD